MFAVSLLENGVSIENASVAPRPFIGSNHQTGIISHGCDDTARMKREDEVRNAWT
jgi:hypothetical protein